MSLHSKQMLKSLLAMGVLVSGVAAMAGEPRRYPRDQADRDNDRYQEQFGFRVRIGMVEPEGNSAFWDDAFSGFTGEVGGMDDPSVGGEFVYGLSDNVELWTGVSAFSGSLRSSYEDFTDGFGNEVRHRKTLEVAPLTIGVTAYPFGKDHTFRPFVGAGGGFYLWRYREAGDFIDFTADPLEIVNAEYESDGTTLGYYFLAGIEARVSRNAGLFVEGRWSYADDDPKDGDFENFGELDLRSREVSMGMAWRF